MRSSPSLSRRCALLIVVVSPVFMGSYFRCVAVSNTGGDIGDPGGIGNPSVTTARIDELEPDALRVGEVLQASGSGSGTPPLQFGWDFGDGTLVPGQRAAHVYQTAGSYRVALTVRDALGNTAIDASQVIVSSRLPMSVANVRVSAAIAGEPVVLAVETGDARTHDLAYSWTFSDGQWIVGPEVTAIFPAPGIYAASVMATDELGAVTVAQVAFEVRPDEGRSQASSR